MEQDSIKELMKLHPSIRKDAIEAYSEAVKATPAGVHPYITQTLRSFAESNVLYAKGRDKKGNIVNRGDVVTFAPAGYSYHNYGLALDFVLLINGKQSWTVDKNWMIVVNIFKKHGFTWGGDWSNGKEDYPHLEKRLGKTEKQLKSLHDSGHFDREGYVLI